jgi:hypothetical protein
MSQLSTPTGNQIAEKLENTLEHDGLKHFAVEYTDSGYFVISVRIDAGGFNINPNAMTIINKFFIVENITADSILMFMRLQYRGGIKA